MIAKILQLLGISFTTNLIAFMFLFYYPFVMSIIYFTGGVLGRIMLSDYKFWAGLESVTTDSFFCLVIMTGSWLSHTFFIVAVNVNKQSAYDIVNSISTFLKNSHVIYRCEYHSLYGY